MLLRCNGNGLYGLEKCSFSEKKSLFYLAVFKKTVILQPFSTKHVAEITQLVE